jgi:hypothetical protein
VEQTYNDTMDNEGQPQHLSCPFCGEEPGHLFNVKIFCRNEECAIYDLPIDAEKWNGRGATVTVLP